MVEPSGTVVVVAGAAVALVGAVVVVGSGVTVTVGVSVRVGGTVAPGGPMKIPKYGTPSSTDRLAVAEKLAPIDASGEPGCGGTVGVTGCDCVVVTGTDSVVVTVTGAVVVTVPVSAESAIGRSASGSAVAPALDRPTDTGSAFGAPGAGPKAAPPPRGAFPSNIRTVDSPATAAVLAPAGESESACTVSVTPIAVLINAATAPARVTCRCHRLPECPAVRGTMCVGESAA